MIFQRQQNTVFLRGRKTLFDRIDTPFESIVLRISLEYRLDAAVCHQLVERFDRTPASRVEPQTRHAHACCKLNAMNGMIDLLCEELLVRRNKTLVDRKAGECNAVHEGVALESLDIGVILTFHLAVKDVDAFNPNARGFIDYLLDWKLLFREMPV